MRVVMLPEGIEIGADTLPVFSRHVDRTYYVPHVAQGALKNSRLCLFLTNVQCRSSVSVLKYSCGHILLYIVFNHILFFFVPC